MSQPLLWFPFVVATGIVGCGEKYKSPLHPNLIPLEFVTEWLLGVHPASQQNSLSVQTKDAQQVLADTW